MRILLALFATLSSACAAWPKPELVDSFLTSGGVRVEYARCETPVESGDYTFQFHNIRLIENGKVRTEPKFRFDMPWLTELTGTQGNGVLRLLDELSRDACVDMRNPAQAKLAEDYYNRVRKITFEVALEFETLKTEEEFKAAVYSAHTKFEELWAEQKSGYATSGTPN